ncbi:guanylate kinase [Echinicola marina]|uniref:guanylate kinase n=1 Tax=Echinicola marina TaxID=2859768 RepID=UPI001CF6F03D|nr:guanylate kinase [Echinicola marina]UCS93710.1 guanylate kinase [Echinicola marina]
MSFGKAFIFSAPSGSGKTTIVHHLLSNHDNLDFSISACTRDKRGKEVDGKDYYFLSLDDFKKKIGEDAFIEWEEVYEGNFYGTLKSEMQRIWDSGKHVVFDVDVKGGLKIKEYFGNRALAVFVKVPSLEVLAERLKDRGTESPENLEKRINKAKYEMSFQDKFDAVLVNDDMEKSFEKAAKLVDEFIGK